MSYPWRMVISSIKLTKATFTPLLLFHSEPRFLNTDFFCFLKDTPVNCFNNFGQSVDIARHQGDENPNSSVVTETMKLLTNSSYGYQFVDCNRLPVTSYMKEKKTPAEINKEVFKILGHINDQL